MTDIAAINYQPLDAMKNSWWHTVKSSFKGKGLIVAILVIAASIALLFLGGVGIYLFVGYALYIGWQVQKYQDQIWRSFAAANGWTVDIGVPDLTLISPSLNDGHSQKLSPVIQASVNSLSLNLFSYICTTGSGRYSQDHYFTVAMVTLPKSLPHMLLLSKKVRVDARANLDNHEKLQLEGDFGNYFELQIEKGQEINVLSIITPDVMQALVNNNQSEDVEIFNNYLYFILRNDKRDSVSVQALINSVNGLSDEIIQNINHGTPAQSQLATPNVAPSAAADPTSQAPNTGRAQEDRLE